MTFRIPMGVQARFYALLITRESPRGHSRSSVNNIAVTVIGCRPILISAELVINIISPAIFSGSWFVLLAFYALTP